VNRLGIPLQNRAYIWAKKGVYNSNPAYTPMKTGSVLILTVVMALSPAALAQQQRNAGNGGGRNAANNSNANNTPSNNSGGSNTPSNNANGSSNSSNQINAQPISDQQGSQVSDAYNRSLFNADNFSVDSENGIFTWRGNKFDIGNNLIVRQRFERYLTSPGYADTNQDYQSTLKEIQDLLSTNTDTSALPAAQGGDRIYQAWELLFKAAQFPEDAGASETLANQVYDAWRVRDELANNRNDYHQLDNQRKDGEFGLAADGENAANQAVEFAQANPGLANPSHGVGINSQGQPNAPAPSNNARGNNSQSSSSGGSASSSGTSSGNSGGTGGGSAGVSPNGPDLNLNVGNISLGGGDSGAPPTQLPTMHGTGLTAMHSAELARTYVKQALLDADASTMGLQVKLQYQTQLLAFIMQRRFEHSLIAGQFYEHIFKGSQQRMNIAKEEMAKFMNSDTVVPSANSFEFISHEAIADVESGMKAVQTAYNAGDRWTALQQLQQTFLIGENLPSVQDFDPAKRRVLLNIYRESTDLKHAIDMRDFGSADATVQKLQGDAQDFQAGPVLSAIQEGEQTSNLALMAAQQAIMSGDTDRFTTNMQKATELWPLNPDIKKFSKNMLDKGDLANVGTAKFDELLSHGDERGIFEARNELGLAVYQDPVRSAKLKDILDRMGKVEMMIAYADQAMKQKNSYAAWEALVSAADIEPNDPVLDRTKAQVVPQAATFVAALDSASRADQAGDYAASLNYYLQAQDIYPASQICHDAIERISTKLMATLNPTGASARMLQQQPATPPATTPTTPAPAAETATPPTAAGNSGAKPLF